MSASVARLESWVAASGFCSPGWTCLRRRPRSHPVAFALHMNDRTSRPICEVRTGSTIFWVTFSLLGGLWRLANYWTSPPRTKRGSRNELPCYPPISPFVPPISIFSSASRSSQFADCMNPFGCDGHHMTERRCQCFRHPFSSDPSYSGLSTLGSPDVTLTMKREIATPRAFPGLRTEAAENRTSQATNL
ncbi:hypothetical protein BO78DRAFT_175081 [Aspergillus sclerotiicarbonarius CBS 121057]|uniref:Uncharacterized protein n=1 Tax=Aspergillus sclerotiicarbonarius (strain CBS 121057 / IBT 28362) TaxID=1448318 RepID=A0A319E2F7_ASPSB|nr:hypothetical protein BO78DRAFT_175081 [Aspergillus sclerotiicarbonarius CBS 121057]